MKIEIYSKYENGKLTNSKAVKSAFERLSGKDIKITIEPKRKQRSGLQNRYYWGVLVTQNVPQVRRHFKRWFEK